VRSRLNSASSGVSLTRVSVVFFVQQLDDVLAHGVEAHPLFHEDRRRHRSLLAEDPQKEVLGADVVMEQAVGFFCRKLQNALGFRAERDFDRGGDLLAEDRAAFDFLADVLERQMRASEDPAGKPLALANQSEQEVLGLNRNAAELTGLVAGEEKYSSSPFGVAFEHPGT